ncbi:MAG: c-type cytochrome [Lysobacterales bacterium]|jgi:mono/diheme cytochrome c family protein/rhodanese-related sulfurtransferase
MKQGLFCLAAAFGLLANAAAVSAQDILPLTPEESAAAAEDYQRYCVLCHGAERQGYVNDNAPSLRTKSLYHTGFPEFILFTIAYGRRGTPMGGYFDEIGGPMNNDELYRLTRWLREQVGVDSVDYPREPVQGDVQRGEEIYAEKCADCHGANGEGVKGPAIANPALLSLASDAFLRYAIVNGRDGTEMPAFGGTLSDTEINAVTAFLRSRETAWSFEKPVLVPPPKPDEYVLNPDGAPPEFPLYQGLYVKSVDLDQALEEKRRMIVLDARVMSMWQVGHIEGAVPVPYYYREFDRLASELPNDGTWIVSYCECPRSAAESVTRKLRAKGFDHTAVLWEGIQGWIALGFPVAAGRPGSTE